MKTRQEYNFAIALLMRNHPESLVQMISGDLERLAKQYPDQRAGQIICNYICGDYRWGEVSNPTKVIMGTMFPGNPDPFFEESSETYARMKKQVEV